MRHTRLIMGMPITAEVVSDDVYVEQILSKVFSYFTDVDMQFSTYKPESEIMRINRGEIHEREWSSEVKEVFALAKRTKEQSSGYFNIVRSDGFIDPSGIVKGWAIQNAAELLRNAGYKDFYIEAGGDVQTSGKGPKHQQWSVGIRNPFNTKQIVKVLYPRNCGMATSGTYERGQHIYNPHAPSASLDQIASITVIGPNVCEADRFATAAFAMGRSGIQFIESLIDMEAYSIDSQGIATMTSNLDTYTK